MDKQRAKEIIMAHSCCSFSNGENKLCMLCPYNKIDCVDIRLDEEVIIEAMKVLEGVDEMKRIKLSEIKISSAFANTTPSPHKIHKYRESYRENCHRQEKPIVIDKNNYLRDGYIQYLILKEDGVDEAMIIRKNKYKNNKISRKIPAYKNSKTTYIYGIHPEDKLKKERVWRVPNTWIGWEKDLLPGDNIIVDTKYGIRTIVITRIEWLDKPPVDYVIRRVVKKH